LAFAAIADGKKAPEAEVLSRLRLYCKSHFRDGNYY